MAKKNPLKEFFRPQLGDARQHAITQIENESDHALVLMMTSFLDQELEEELKFRLPNHDRITDLFDHTGPLGTFSAKIKMVFALGLVGPRAFSDMNILRGLRNLFAHSPRILTLNEPLIRQECLRLGGVNRHEIHYLINQSLGEVPETMARRHFWLNCVWFLSSFSQRRERGDRDMRTVSGCHAHLDLPRVYPEQAVEGEETRATS